jgi:sortase (surface protein transpeptidase)
MRRLRPLLVLLALAAFVASCAADDAADEGASPAGSSAVTALDEGEASADPSEPGSITEATIQQMLAMDPDVLASAHDHRNGDGDGHADHADHATRAHPNGVDPERIVIPAIGVDADVIDLGLQDDGTMEVPSDFAQTGWFDRGPKPGRVGPAVIAGHVDSTTGPAVFFRLSELSAGDEIEVHGEDGEIVTFAVREIQQHPKDEFPTEAVYSGTPGAELRLITCSGEFDQGERSYRDNTIVFAERVD